MASRNVNEEEFFKRYAKPQQPASPTSEFGSFDEDEDEDVEMPELPVEWNCELGKIRKEQCTLLEEEDHTTLRCGHQFHSECLNSYLRVEGVITNNSSDTARTIGEFHCPSCHQLTSPVAELDVD
jgi:hypothetical protein